MSESPQRIFLSPPDVGPRERELLLDAYDSNWIAPLGPHVDAFEREVSSQSGRKEGVATSAGTAALHLALRYVGVEQGDTVFTSSLTFAATANAIRYLNAVPVFVDATSESWNIDPTILAEGLAAAAEKRSLPKAVVPVDLYGQCADYDAIAELCEKYEVPLIVDAAESLGATYDDQPAGSVGEAAILSFNGNKIITTSGGGMLVTDDPIFAEKTRFWATQARDQAPHYQHSELGYNYRLSNLLAAVGRGQLEGLSSKVDRRRSHNQFYRQALDNLPGVSFMPEAAKCRSTFWLTALQVDPGQAGCTRDDIRSALEAENIEARPVWKPMHMQPLYRENQMLGGEVSERLFAQGLCLPSGSSLSDDELDRVASIVVNCFA